MNDTIPSTIQEMHASLENKMIEVLAILEAHYKKPMPIPSVKLIPRLGRKLGFARQRDNSIGLNQDLCNEKHWNTILNTVLGHEVCHLVAPIIYNEWQHGPDRGRGWSHGRAWKQCMRVIGLPPDRTHDLDEETSKSMAIRVIRRDYVYSCPCGKTFNLTVILHNKIQTGRYRICRACKGKLVYKGQKIVA